MNRHQKVPEPADGEFFRGLFAALSDAPASVLFLDYDGTLAPFKTDRMAAIPYPGVREALDAIRDAGSTRVVMVSGRVVDEVETLLGLRTPVEIWGSHGLVRKSITGAVETIDVTDPVRSALAAAREGLEASGLRAHVEEKPGCCAVHLRGLSGSRAQHLEDQARAILAPLAEKTGMLLHPFDGGIELRSPRASKSYSVEQVLAETPPDSFVAYLGDDLTDEDAFAVLPERGVSLLVRQEPRESLAHRWIRPPKQLLDFLNGWRRATNREVIP